MSKKNELRPTMPVRVPAQSGPSFLWRLPGIIGIAVVILAGILPWGRSNWPIGGTKLYIGLNNDYGVRSTGLALVALVLLLAIRHNVLAHLIALAPIVGAALVASDAKNNVEELTEYALNRDVMMGPDVVLLGGALVGISFVLAILQEFTPNSDDVHGEIARKSNVSASARNCPKCGALVRSGAMYCVCGARVSNDTITGRGTASEETRPTSANVRYCPKCGESVRSTTMYCVCGARVNRNGD